MKKIIINLKTKKIIELVLFCNLFNIIFYFHQNLIISNIFIIKYSHDDQKMESCKDKRISSTNTFNKHINSVKCVHFLYYLHQNSLNSIEIPSYHNKWISLIFVKEFILAIEIILIWFHTTITYLGDPLGKDKLRICIVFGDISLTQSMSLHVSFCFYQYCPTNSNTIASIIRCHIINTTRSSDNDQ